MKEKEIKVQPELSEFEKTAEIAMQAMMNTKRGENEGFIFVTTRDLGDTSRISCSGEGSGENMARMLKNLLEHNPEIENIFLAVMLSHSKKKLNTLMGEGDEPEDED